MNVKNILRNQSLEEQASQPSKSKQWSDDEKRTMAVLEKYKKSGLVLRDLNSYYLAAKLNRSVTVVQA